jgi:hypothetical protein
METILGLIMLYAWVHSIVIIVKKLKEPTGYETAVLIAGAVGFVLYIIGTVGG